MVSANFKRNLQVEKTEVFFVKNRISANKNF